GRAVTGVPPWWRVRAPIGRGVATSHNRTQPSRKPPTRVLPSGLNATEVSQPSWLMRGPPIGRRVATSHKTALPLLSALPLLLPAARVLPSGLNATELTRPLWPVWGPPTCWRGAASPSPDTATP